MNWEIAGITFAFMVLGYLIGSVVNVVWVTKFLAIEDVRKHGSGNAGSTNALRVHGRIIGLIVFTLDFVKPIIAIAIPYFAVGADKVILHVVGLSVIVGHIFPIYYKFKGGKGAAAMAGLFVSLSWPLFFVGLFVLSVFLLLTKKVSLGSLFSPIITIMVYVGLIYISGYRSYIFEPYFHSYPATMNIVTMILALLLVIFAHYKNIIRLYFGREKRIKVTRNTWKELKDKKE